MLLGMKPGAGLLLFFALMTFPAPGLWAIRSGQESQADAPVLRGVDNVRGNAGGDPTQSPESAAFGDDVGAGRLPERLPANSAEPEEDAFGPAAGPSLNFTVNPLRTWDDKPIILADGRFTPEFLDSIPAGHLQEMIDSREDMLEELHAEADDLRHQIDELESDIEEERARYEHFKTRMDSPPSQGWVDGYYTSINMLSVLGWKMRDLQDRLQAAGRRTQEISRQLGQLDVRQDAVWQD